MPKKASRERQEMIRRVKKIIEESPGQKTAEAPERNSLDAEDPPFEMVMEAIEFLRSYQGGHPYLRRLAVLAKGNPRWVPSDKVALTVHRIAHFANLNARQQVDGMSTLTISERLKEMEQENLPDSLADPDEHGL